MIRLQRFESRNIGISLDEHRARASQCQRIVEKRPDSFVDWRAVGVDQQFISEHGVRRMPGNVNLSDSRMRKVVEIGNRVEAQIVAADMDVIDIEEQPAAD